MFLPDPKQRGNIKFLVAKWMPYGLRMFFVVAFLLTGLAMQLGYSFGYGFGLLVIGTLFGVVEGYDTKPKLANSEEEWSSVTPDEYVKILKRMDELNRWDSDLFAANCNSGSVFMGFSIVAMMLVFGYLLVAYPNSSIPLYWIADFMLLVVPHWYIGTKEYLRLNRMQVQLKALQYAMSQLADSTHVQVQPMLAIRRTVDGKEVPNDVKLMAKYVGAPKDFMGIQMQVSINSVQGTDYPYFYCVLLAQKGSHLFSSVLKHMDEFGDKIVIEADSQLTAEIIVMRQFAEGNVGYCTGPKDISRIISASIAMAEQLFDDAATEGVRR
jgi:hypothetical protein